MNFDYSEIEIKSIIESSRQSAENILKNSSSDPNIILKQKIEDKFSFFNSSSTSNSPTFLYVKEVNLEIINNHDFDKSKIGAGLIIAGQPILKKRFVMSGSAVGTSIASKYLSKAFPQQMSIRVLGTRVLGRAIGRAIPYVGWGLLAIDAIELFIEEYKGTPKKGSFSGFGGGSFGGGGASRNW